MKDLPKLPAIPPSPFYRFTPTPGKRVRFRDGQVVALNRKQRRGLHIYNKDLRRTAVWQEE